MKITPKQALTTLTTRYPNLDWSITVYDKDGGNKQLVDFICEKHGLQTQYYNVLVASKTKHLVGCAKCNNENRGMRSIIPWASVLAQLKAVHYDKNYKYKSSSYRGTMYPIEVMCNSHEKPYYWQATPNNLISKKSGCPACASVHPKQQLALYQEFEYLDVESNRRDLLGNGKEIDLYFPTHNLGVEVNGMLWHGELYKERNYHSDKYEQAKQQGIRLIQFWDFEVEYKFQLVKSMINNRLGLSKTIGARKCEVVTLGDSSIPRQFLSENHIQGACKSQIYLGLMYGSKLAAVMSFHVPRFTKDFQFELVRYCSHRSITVVGGASKLWKFFCKTYNPKSVVSYANRRYSDGNLYEVLGFDLSHVSQPNYMWAMNMNYTLSRYQTQAKKLPRLLGDSYDPNISSNANMLNTGYYRVYDAGNYVFTFNR